MTKNKLIGFVVACLLYLCCMLMLLRALPSLVVAVLPVLYSNNQAREGTKQHQHKAQQV